jgi:F-type H+-transporting ATPase subunit delta
VRAIIDSARRDESWDAWEADLRAVRAVASDDRIRIFLENPSVPRARRLGVIDQFRDERLGMRGRGFLRLLTEARELALARDVERAFLRSADEARRLDRVVVTTAAGLHETEVEELRRRLRRPGWNLHLSTETDPVILGGVIIRRGDNVLDLSVRAKLRSLASALR